MKLICPGCGLTASAEAWQNDADCRAALVATMKLPHQLHGQVLPYLGLFRPESRALTWKKAHKLVGELAKLVAAGHVQVDRKPARPCPIKTWAEAMDDMIARHEGKRPHFSNHNYLRKVAYDLADRADAKNESQGEELKSYEHHRQPEPRSIKSPLAAFAAGEIESLPGGEDA